MKTRIIFYSYSVHEIRAQKSAYNVHDWSIGAGKDWSVTNTTILTAHP